jgi:hypothetical protein
MRVSAMKNRACLVSFGAAMVFGTALGEPALAQDNPQLLEGKAAFTDWRWKKPPRAQKKSPCNRGFLRNHPPTRGQADGGEGLATTQGLSPRGEA